MTIKKTGVACIKCGDMAAEGKRRCLKHIVLGNEATKRLREKKRAMGLCAQCSNKALQGATRCQKHVDMHNEDYRRKVEKGLCPRCRRAPADGKIYCADCQEYDKARNRTLLSMGKCPNHKDEDVNPTKRCRRCARLAFESQLRSKYKLSVEDYAWMELFQHRKCMVCREQPQDGLVVDHNHKTNGVRALLCGPCNRTIGHAEENVQRLLAAARYLSSP